MKYSIIGLVLWIGAAIYWFFGKIASVTGKTLEIFTIEELIGLDWIEKIPWPKLYPAAEFIGTTQIPLLILAVGLVFIIIGMFFKT
ncbi:MAG: hypothetical protein AB1724_13605 [Thermodesulfobacteriota bacterium]